MNLGLDAGGVDAVLYSLQIIVSGLVFVSIRLSGVSSTGVSSAGVSSAGVLPVVILMAAYFIGIVFFSAVHFMNLRVEKRRPAKISAGNGAVRDSPSAP
jgi:hypothetical protein